MKSIKQELFQLVEKDMVNNLRWSLWEILWDEIDNQISGINIHLYMDLKE